MDTLKSTSLLQKSSVESVLYLIGFIFVFIILSRYIFKHLKYSFLYGLNQLDEYVINYKGLDKEDFADHLVTTPKLYVLNTVLGSVISFEHTDDRIIAYLCTIKNTSDVDAPQIMKIIKPQDEMSSENKFVIHDLKDIQGDDVYSVFIQPIIKDSKTKETSLQSEDNFKSNVVYAYKKDEDPELKYLKTIPFDDNIENYNFSSDITKKVYS